MKNQVKKLAIIGVLICSLTIYLNFSKNNQNQENSEHKPSESSKVLKKEANAYTKPIQKEITPVAKTVIDSPKPLAIIQPETANPVTIIQSEALVNETTITPETEVLEPTTNTNTETITTMPDNSENTTLTEELPVQLTADEVYAAQTDPIIIDLTYQGNWKSLDGSRTIIGTQYGFKIENSPIGWLNRYSKNEVGLILGDTNYFTFYVRLTENDHLIIEKTDGTEFWEFVRNYQ